MTTERKRRRELRRNAHSVRLLERAEGDDDSPRRVEVVASTETPVRVWGADEVLSHKRGAVDLSRFRDAPVLVDHSMRVESIVGRVVEAKVVDRQLVATAELAKGEDRIERLLDDGMLRDVSIGFDVSKWERTRDRDPDTGEAAEYTAKRWAPYEFSFVAVGADPAAKITGVRADYGDEEESEQQREGREMPDEDKKNDREQPDENKIAEGVRAAVVKDNNEMFAFGDEYETVGGPELARAVVAEGGDMADLKQRIFEATTKRLKDAETKTGGDELGLSRKEVADFSFIRLFRALKDPNNQRERDAAGHELEVAEAAADRMKSDEKLTGSVGGTVIPVDVLRAPICGSRNVAERVADHLRRRAVTVGTDAEGGYLVADNLLASSYIDILRAASAILPKATVLPGLIGNYEIPRLKTSVDPSWVPETTNADQGLVTPAWDEVKLSPKKMYCGTALSHTALIQTTPEVEALTRMDIVLQEALKIDRAAFEGAGADDQPKGIRNQDDVNDVTPATGGANGHTLTRDLLIDMRTEIAVANGITGAETYFMHPLVGGKLRKTKNDADGAAEGWLWDNRTPARPVNGQMAVETTNMAADGAKGTGTELSTIYFGNPQTVFVGYWGGLDIQLDPYTARRQGQIVVSVIRFADIAIRHPKQFSFIKDVVGNK